MFCLAEKIHSNPVRIGLTVANHQNFRRTGDHINADGTEHIALGSSHVGVARSDDLVNGRNSFRAVSQSGNGLRAADGVALFNAGQAGRGKNELIGFAARSRNNHHNLLAAGNVSRHGVHQNGRRVRGFTARNIETDGIERNVADAELCSVFFRNGPALSEFVFVELADTLSSLSQGVFLVFRKRFKSFFQVVFGQTEFGNALGVHMVETIGVLKDGLVPSGADILNDGFGAACDFGINRAVDCNKLREFGREIGLLCIQSSNAHSFFTVFAKISIKGSSSWRFNFIAVLPTMRREEM